MAKFVSRYKNHCIVMKPSYTRVTNGIPEIIPGERIEFRAGKFETNDPKKIEHLRKHPEYGRRIIEIEAPEDILAKSIAQLKEYLAGVTDMNRLKVLADTEKAGKNREGALSVIKERINELIG